MARTLALALGAAVAESLGLMLLVPLLSLAGALGGEVSRPAWPGNVDRMLTGVDPGSRLAAVLAVFVIVVAVQALLAMLRDRGTNLLHLRFVDGLREELFARIAGCRWDYLARRHSSEYLNTLTADLHRVGMGTQSLLQIVALAFMAGAYVAVALLLSAQLTVLALVMGLLIWRLMRKSQAEVRSSGLVLSKAGTDLLWTLQEFIASLKLVKTHAEEPSAEAGFRAAVARVRDQQVAFREAQTRAQAIYRVSGAVGLSLVAYASLDVLRMPTASLLVLLALFVRLLPQLQQLQAAAAQVVHMLPAWEQWKRQIADWAAHAEPPTGPEEANVSLNDSIVLEGVRHAHADSAFVLRADSVAIPARQTTLVCGTSGSGKTTLLEILGGLRTPEAGRVLVDGREARLHSPGWRQGLACLLQEAVLMDGTVRENLGWGRAVASDSELWTALEQASAATFVRALPLGLDTRVGERGVNLSGGERQRLALARALLRKPQLLILDEATNSLDDANRAAIHEALRALRGQVTMLIVTHQDDGLERLADGRVEVVGGIVGPWTRTPDPS